MKTKEIENIKNTKIGSRQDIRQIVEKACDEVKCRLYLLEFTSKGVQIFVDKPNEFISISDCAKISKRIEFFITTSELSFPGELEISSPGLERKLTMPWHFKEVVQKKIHVLTLESYEGYQEFIGDLISANEEFIQVEDKGKTWSFPYESIKKAHLLFALKKNKKINLKKKCI